MDLFGLQEPDSPEVTPTSPDYVPGPEELEQAPTSPNYVPGPKYLGYLTPADDEIVIEDPSYANDALPIALSPGYVADSDPEEDSEDGPVDYPANGGDDDDDDDSFDDDEEEKEASEEEHLALADSVQLSLVDHCIAPRGFRATMGRLRASSPSTHHPLHPSPPLSPLPISLFILPLVNHREDILDAELPPRKRLCLTALTLRFKVDPAEDVEEVAPTTLEEVNARVTELAEAQEEDTQDIYALGQLSAAIQIQALQARDSTYADDPEGADSSSTATGFNNIPPKRTSVVVARAAVAAAAAAPMTTVAVEQLIEARVIRGTVRTPRECTYKDFLNCQQLTVKGTEGVVVLSQWFEKMESVFHISNCAMENQKTLKKMMIVKYCPRGEIKKLEIELWNPKVKGTDVTSYTLHFQELALMCGRMFLEESDEVERYVGGLPDMIRENVMSYQPKTMEKAIEFANDQMD
ncbi:hypothetical protein Tco_0479007 [Tanacetum coccineum]